MGYFNNFRRWTMLIPALALGSLVSGCLSVEYVGQSFSDKDQGEAVYYSLKTPLPTDKYTPIGRGELSTRQDLNAMEIEKLFLEKATEVGADAVKIVNIQVVPSGRMLASPTGEEMRLSSSVATTTPEYSNIDLGSERALQSKKTVVYTTLVQALFLVDNYRYEAAMEELRRLHDEQIQKELAERTQPRKPATEVKSDNKDENLLTEVEQAIVKDDGMIPLGTDQVSIQLGPNPKENNSSSDQVVGPNPIFEVDADSPDGTLQEFMN